MEAGKLNTMLMAVMQRLPAASSVAVLVMALFAERASYGLIALWAATHAMLFINALLSIVGTWSSWRSVKRNIAIDWTVSAPEKLALGSTIDASEVRHVVLVPNFKESIETLRETLVVLASHSRATDVYHVVLGMEARETGAQDKAARLIAEFERSFGSITATIHPASPLEVAGKGSNLAFSGRAVAAEMTPEQIAKTVFTILDADVHLAQDYFDALSTKFAAKSPSSRALSMWCIPILFDRNANAVPRPVRTVDSQWSTAGLSSVYDGSSIRIPTSAYSISASLLCAIDYHDAGAVGIGEDMHTMVKAYFDTSGQLEVDTIWSPASCCDVVGASHGRGGLRAYLEDMLARYYQARRHMVGMLDSSYVLTRLLTGSHGQALDSRSGAPTPSQSPYFQAALTSKDLAEIEKLELGPGKGGRDALEAIHRRRSARLPILRTAWLLTRLYHAHFMLIHFFILLGINALSPFAPRLIPQVCSGSSKIDGAVCATSIAIFDAATAIRAFTVFASISAHIGYELYARAAEQRWSQSDRLGKRAAETCKRELPWCLIGASWLAQCRLTHSDAVAIPVGFVYSVVPMIYCQALLVFTDRLQYVVSLKPSIKPALVVSTTV